MWNYEKRLQYPVNIKTPNAKLAQFIMSQYGGPDGEQEPPCVIFPSVLLRRTGWQQQFLMMLRQKNWHIWKWYPPLFIS